MAWVPVASSRKPHAGSSVIWASAISQLFVGSHPANSMPAALRTTLRPPSQPTRYSARSDVPSDSATSTLDVVLRETSDLASAIDPHPKLIDPAGEDALGLLLPQSEEITMPGREVADIQRV